MFSSHLCSYIAQLLKNLSIPMVTIYIFCCYDCNKPLRMKHFCSNYLISRIKKITLVNARDLEKCAAWAVFPSIQKKGTILRVEVVSDLAYEFCSCVDIYLS